jgi:calpain-7
MSHQSLLLCPFLFFDHHREPWSSGEWRREPRCVRAHTTVSRLLCLAHQANAIIFTSPAKAAEALIAQSRGQDALDATIQTIELYMKAAGEAPSKAEATRIRRKCQSLFTYAEKLKRDIDPLQFAEQQILREASRLHGNQFHQWRTEPLEHEFANPASGELFM